MNIMKVAVIFLMLFFFIGCDLGRKNKSENQEKVTLKVMYWSETQFYNDYGNFFSGKFPNIQFEIIDIQYLFNGGATNFQSNLFNLIKEKKPDVLLLSENDYEKLVSEKKLINLDLLIKRDNYKVDGMHPAILNILRSKGNNNLYGLSSIFTSKALYYNVDLFSKYGIQPPQNQMSWYEVLAIAEEFRVAQKSSEVYGMTVDETDFSLNSLSSFILNMGETENLAMVSTDGERILFNTKSWERVFSAVSRAIKSNSLFLPSKNNETSSSDVMNLLSNNKFINGQSAMLIGGSSFVNMLLLAKQKLNGVSPVNWQLVTVPVDPNNRQQSSSFFLGPIFGVNANTQNLNAAWEFVKFIGSDEYAELKSRMPMIGPLLARTSFNRDQDGRSMKPFFMLDPKPLPSDSIRTMPLAFYNSISELINSTMFDVKKDNKSLTDAIKLIQDEGQNELNAINLQKEKQN